MLGRTSPQHPSRETQRDRHPGPSPSPFQVEGRQGAPAQGDSRVGTFHGVPLWGMVTSPSPPALAHAQGDLCASCGAVTLCPALESSSTETAPSKFLSSHPESIPPTLDPGVLTTSSPLNTQCGRGSLACNPLAIPAPAPLYPSPDMRVRRDEALTTCLPTRPGREGPRQRPGQCCHRLRSLRAEGHNMASTKSHLLASK